MFKNQIIIKNLLASVLLLISINTIAQSGEVWPIYSRQEFDLNENFEVTKEYESKTVCSFFMFLDNNEFLHATDNITSLYKIIKREEADSVSTYTVISEAENIYTYSFSKKDNTVIILTSKGYGIYYSCLEPYKTKVFKDINK